MMCSVVVIIAGTFISQAYADAMNRHIIPDHFFAEKNKFADMVLQNLRQIRQGNAPAIETGVSHDNFVKNCLHCDNLVGRACDAKAKYEELLSVALEKLRNSEIAEHNELKQKIASAEQMISMAAEVISSDAAAKAQQRAIAAAAIAVKEAAKAAATRLRGAASQSAAERVEEASFASEQAEDYLCEKLFNRKQLTAGNLPHADLDGTTFGKVRREDTRYPIHLSHPVLPSSIFHSEVTQ